MQSVFINYNYPYVLITTVIYTFLWQDVAGLASNYRSHVIIYTINDFIIIRVLLRPDYCMHVYLLI